MKKIEFNGVTVEYDERRANSYKWQKRIAKSDMSAVEDLLLGRDEEVADKLGDDSDAMQDLVIAIINRSKAAKN